jgi:hypothetical protein
MFHELLLRWHPRNTAKDPLVSATAMCMASTFGAVSDDVDPGRGDAALRYDRIMGRRLSFVSIPGVDTSDESVELQPFDLPSTRPRESNY